jgi:hypothetical protein
MRHLERKCAATLALALALTLAGPPPAAHARPGAGTGAAGTAGTGTSLQDSALGGLAAMGCGFMVRATIVTGGTQVGTIAGAVACCAYMLLDAWASGD